MRSELGEIRNRLSMVDEETNSLRKEVYDLKKDSIIKNGEYGEYRGTDTDHANIEEPDRYQQFYELSNQRIEELEEEIRKKDDELLQLSINYEEKLERMGR